MNLTHLLKKDTKIMFHISDDLKGTGSIVGIALTDLSVIGTTYIIKPDESIECEQYPYEYFICPENRITVL